MEFYHMGLIFCPPVGGGEMDAAREQGIIGRQADTGKMAAACMRDRFGGYQFHHFPGNGFTPAGNHFGGYVRLWQTADRFPGDHIYFKKQFLALPDRSHGLYAARNVCVGTDPAGKPKEADLWYLGTVCAASPASDGNGLFG